MSTLLSQAPAPVAEVTGDSAPAIDGAGAAMAACLQAWGAGAQMQTAARLLPQVVAQTLDLAVVATTHGAAIADLCRDYLQVLDLRADVQWSGAPAAWQRTLGYIAAYHDPRLAFLTVAHLWQQVVKAPTSGARRSQQAREIARGALAPLLDMLGMRVPRIELEALICEECDDDTPDDWRQAADAIVVALTPHLPTAACTPVDYTLMLIPTKYTQIHNLSFLGGRNAQKLTHTLNIHVLVDDLDGCYQALRWVHDLWIPIEGTLIDTLNAPRVSGYRALHTAVVAQMPGGKTRVNFVITTHAQYAINMWGLAAVYLRGRAVEDAPGAWWGNRAAGYAQIMSAQPGALPERLYVFSPQGQLFGFDRGSTVVDFAYHVHSELAEQCRSFTVNGRQVEPAHVLRHLDIVELEHDPKAPGPNRRWLLAAHTSRARSAIERYLKRQGPGAHHGQKLIDERLKTLEQHYGFNLPPEKVEQALQATIRCEAFATRDDLLTAVAAGQYPIDRILHRLFEKEILRLVEMPRGLRLRPHQLHLAQCCRPKPGDPVVGRVYRRHGEAVNLTVHNAACAHIANHPDLTPLKWRLRPHMLTVARIDLRALDDEGLLGAVMAEVYARQPRVTLHQLHALARHGSARIQFDLHADQEATVAEIVEALRTLPDFTVTDVQSLQLPPSEQAEWQEVAGGGSFNPYSRLPVHQDAMFFGRAQERERIVEYLRTQQPGVWLIGQKRVGKTSLLLHLKEHYLPARNFTPVFIDFQLMGHPAQTNLFYQVASIIYSSLSSEGRLGDVGAPLQSLFDDDPARRLIEYLQNVQDALNGRKLVLLMDEFSRLTDAYLQGELEGAIFDRWRGMMHTTQRLGVGYVVVMQQQTCDTLVQHLQQTPNDPSWRLMDVGQRIQLRPLEGEDVRRLIEWPMRTHLDYTAETVDAIAELTGGSPFLIQAFCHNLVMHMAHQGRQQILPEDVEQVRRDFMQPQDHTFAHMTEMLRGIANHVAATLARLAHAAPDGEVSWAKLRAGLPGVAPESLRTSLRMLTEQDILQQPAADRWRFASRLFQQWLAVNG
jgi:(p)ppGpp synthase/HD superfamily hydrolase